MGAYQALAAHGRRVPDDVSVVSFDGSELAGWLLPEVTSTRLLAGLGALAVRHRRARAGRGVHPGADDRLRGGSVRWRDGARRERRPRWSRGDLTTTGSGTSGSSTTQSPRYVTTFFLKAPRSLGDLSSGTERLRRPRHLTGPVQWTRARTPCGHRAPAFDDPTPGPAAWSAATTCSAGLHQPPRVPRTAVQ